MRWLAVFEYPPLYSSMTQGVEPHQFDETTLDNVQNFTYLWSNMTNNAIIDQELSSRLGKAASTFGLLTKRVWQNKHLTMDQSEGI